MVIATGPAVSIGMVTEPAGEEPASYLAHSTIAHDRSQMLPVQTVSDHNETRHNETRRLVFSQGTATVFLNCTDFWLEMTPTNLHYYLVLHYLDTTTSERYRFIAGPLNGRVADPFGDTEFLLLEAEVRVPGDPSVAVYLPQYCLDPATTTTPS